jgi:hypothetical protein
MNIQGEVRMVGVSSGFGFDYLIMADRNAEDVRGERNVPEMWANLGAEQFTVLVLLLSSMDPGPALPINLLGDERNPNPRSSQ